MLTLLGTAFTRSFKTHTKLAVVASFTSSSFPRANAVSKVKMENDEPLVPITSTPKKDQLIAHEGKIFKTVQEGRAYILVPPNARTQLDPQAKGAEDGTQVQNVFYNPIQQFNRDLSVLAIKAFGDDLCQRKSRKRTVQQEKLGKKKERKRKREQEKEESSIDDREEGGVKLQRAEDGSPVRVQDGTSTSEPQVAEAVETTAQGASAPVGDAGATAVPGGRTNGEQEADSSTPALREQTSPATNGIEVSGTTDGKANGSQHTWRPGFRILDALSATGLRALRYATEIPSATAVVANDRDAHAVKNIDMNVQHNKLTDSIQTNTGDAIGYMYSVALPPTHSHGPHHISSKYDVIDLDPYGTASPFIDAALQALEDGGMLCVTCTDSGVFASCGYSEKTFSLYGGMPVKGPYSHEAGLRLIIQSVATAAAKHGISIEPLLSLSIDFYVRIFIRIRKSAADVKFLAGKTMIVYDCDHGCGAWTTQFLGRHTQQPGKTVQMNWKYTIATGPSSDRLCEHCGSKMHIAGPMWGGPIHNPAFIEKMLEDLKEVDPEIYQTKARVEGMLDTALDEAFVNSDAMDYRPAITGSETEVPIIPQTPPQAIDHHPFFFIPSALCKVMHSQAPAENMIKGALRHAGYRVSRSHCKPGSLKTDAPWIVIWEIFREWVRQKAPVKEGALKESSPGWRILQGVRKVDAGATSAGSESAVNGNEEEEEGDGTAAAISSDTPTKRLKVVFDEQLGRDKPGKRLVRYQMNPRENWGPMTRAKGHA